MFTGSYNGKGKETATESQHRDLEEIAEQSTEPAKWKRTDGKVVTPL